MLLGIIYAIVLLIFQYPEGHYGPFFKNWRLTILHTTCFLMESQLIVLTLTAELLRALGQF